MLTAPARTDILYGTVVEWPRAQSEIGLRLLDGRSERIALRTVRPTPFTMSEPQADRDGDQRIDVDVLSFELEGESEVLWPGAVIRASAGVDAAGAARPVRGVAVIPAGKTIEDGLPTEMHLYIRIETPAGTLQNARAIRMKGLLHAIPPAGDVFQSAEDVPVADEHGNVVGTLWACTCR